MRPSFNFYPDNYMNDAGVRRCSPETRGIWIDLLCLMHQGNPYGNLTGPAGNHPIKFLAEWCGVRQAIVKRALAELAENGVYSVTVEGSIFSRRMVRDEHNRTARAVGGKHSSENAAVPRRKGILSASSEGILPPGDDEGIGKTLKKEGCDDSDIFIWAQQKIGEYPGAQFLPGKPDSVIVEKCLKIAHGDPHSLARALNSMYKAGKKPDISWAWFPKVLPQFLNGDRA